MDSGLSSATLGDKWSTDTIIHFLEEYRNHPCLWDSRHLSYKSKSDRICAEIEILRKMKLQYLDLNVFRSKVRNIRNTYRQEVIKIIKNSKREAGADGVFVPKLRWFNLADSFLRKALEFNEIPPAQKCQEEEVLPEPTEPVPEPIPLDDSSALEFEDVKPNLDDLPQLDPSWNPARYPHKRARPWDGPARSDEGHDSAVESQQAERRAGSAAVAEFDAFGQYLSAQLQQLPADVAVELEMEIVNLVCRKRLCLLREDSELTGLGGGQPY